jgi:hypothetical protein
MVRGMLACFAGLLLDAPMALMAAADAAEQPSRESLSCSFVRQHGYYKFSPRKPTGKYGWSFGLQIDPASRQVTFAKQGVLSTLPYSVINGDIRFEVPIENASERVSLNLETRQFSMISETLRHRLWNSGVCQPQAR